MTPTDPHTPLDAAWEGPDSPEHDQTTPDTPDTPEAPTDETTHTPDDGDSGDPDPRLTKARREARNLRERLTDTTTKLDNAHATITRLAEARAEDTAADMGLIDPTDLWRHGVNLTDLHDPDTGGLDPQRVRTAVDDLTRDRPHLRRPAWRDRQNEHLTYEQRMAFGVEPAIDAPAAEWDAWRQARTKHLRSGLSSRDPRKPAPSWAASFEALKHRG